MANDLYERICVELGSYIARLFSRPPQARDENEDVGGDVVNHRQLGAQPADASDHQPPAIRIPICSRPLAQH